MSLCFTLILSILLFSFSQNRIERNFEYLYDTKHQAVFCNLLLLDAGDSVKVYAKITLNKNRTVKYKPLSTYRFNFFYQVYQDYQTRTPILSDTLRNTNTVFDLKNGEIRLSFFIPKFKLYNSAVLFLGVEDLYLDEVTFFDQTLFYENKNHIEDYSLFKKNSPNPFFARSISQKDTFQIRTLGNRFQKLNVKFRRSTFSPALPPMFSLTNVAEEQNPDSSFSVVSDSPLLFASAGVYTLDTPNKDFSFAIQPNFFPYTRKLDDMKGPLVYITTDDEYRNIRYGIKPKKNIDQIWLGFGSTEENAKRIIKLFYHRVQDANMWFSDLKEGWATDRGMIYIVMGSPNKVLKFFDREEWYYYDNDGNALTFVFIKNGTDGTGRVNYELLRSYQYEGIWYLAVEQWRKGLIKE